MNLVVKLRRVGRVYSRYITLSVIGHRSVHCHLTRVRVPPPPSPKSCFQGVLSMLVARGALPPLVLALLGLSSAERTAAVADLFNGSSSSSSSSSPFDQLNITVGGRLRSAVPFEKDCFSIVEGTHVAVSPDACAALQANYTNPLYRAAYFGSYTSVRVPSAACPEHGWSLTHALSADTMGNVPSFERN